MSLLHVELHVKFRFLKITFGTLDRTYNIPLGVIVPVSPKLLSVNERGVQLTLTVISNQGGNL